MENGQFIDDFPIETSIYKGFSMAMLNNQMAYFNHCWILCTQVTSSDLALRGFVAGDTVVAARDLRVRGKVVVRQARVGPVGPLGLGKSWGKPVKSCENEILNLFE
jgi:hypothetical protein